MHLSLCTLFWRTTWRGLRIVCRQRGRMKRCLDQWSSLRLGGLESSVHDQIGSSSRHQTKTSRWFSRDSHSSQEGIETKTEHRLSLWSPMWAGRSLLLCYTRSPSPREDLARHVGCRPKNLNLCFGSRMESGWPCKKLHLRVSCKNEVRDKRNWGKKDAARECLKPEESIKAK
jgi:hypothetical protein